ncbi:MAG TPA: RDD family protein, partial [Verrucomicrobiae bacterium]
MKSDIVNQFTNLGIQIIIAILAWRYYRHRTFPLADRYSTFAPRFWTASVDGCVLWPIGFIALALLSLNIPRSLAALLVIVESLAWLIYTVVMHGRYGQTFGKMATKVRVVDYQTEGQISFHQAWLREGIPMVLSLGLLGYEVFAILTKGADPRTIANSGGLTANKSFWILPALPALWFLAEVLTMLTNSKRRALHDFIAGTVVIRTNATEGAADPGAAPNPL